MLQLAVRKHVLVRENALQSISSWREQLKKWVGVRDHLQATSLKGTKSSDELTNTIYYRIVNTLVHYVCNTRGDFNELSDCLCELLHSASGSRSSGSTDQEELYNRFL